MRDKVKGFSLIELLIALLIISMILSAVLPAITKRVTVNRERIWNWTTQNNVAFTAAGSNQGIVIGHSDVPLKNAAVEELLDTDDTSFTVNFTGVKLSNIGDRISILKRPVDSEATNFENSHISFYNAGYNADAASSVYAGRLAMDNWNIALGKGSLQSITTENVGRNTAIGHYSQIRSTTGHDNTAVGYRTLTNTTTGYNNTAVGYRALSNVTTGYGNTSIGYNAGKAVTTGYYNVSLGTSSNNAVTSGRYNIAIGYGANNAITTAHGNIAIGYNACKNFKTSSAYNICIGYNAGPTASTTTNYTMYMGNSNYTDFYIPMLTRSDDLKALDNDGELKTILEGIYTEAKTKSSDIRKKNVLSENKAGLKEINQLKVYNYTMKDDKHKTPHVGVMAQDLQKVFPDAVSEDKHGFLRIRHEDILYSLVNSIKEICIQIKSMIAQISGLDKRIKELEEQNQDLLEQNMIIQQRLDALEMKK